MSPRYDHEFHMWRDYKSDLPFCVHCGELQRDIKGFCRFKTEIEPYYYLMYSKTPERRDLTIPARTSVIAHVWAMYDKVRFPSFKDKVFCVHCGTKEENKDWRCIQVGSKRFDFIGYAKASDRQQIVIQVNENPAKVKVHENITIPASIAIDPNKFIVMSREARKKKYNEEPKCYTHKEVMEIHQSNEMRRCVTRDRIDFDIPMMQRLIPWRQPGTSDQDIKDMQYYDLYGDGG